MNKNIRCIIFLFLIIQVSKVKAADELKASSITFDGTKVHTFYDEDSSLVDNLIVEKKLFKKGSISVTLFLQEKFDALEKDIRIIRRGWYFNEDGQLQTHINHKGIKIYHKFSEDQGQTYLMLGTDVSLMLIFEIKF